MRILLLTETVPFPLDSGGRIKTYYTLQMLSREHEVHCHTFIRRDEQQALAADLGFCASVTLHLVKRSPLREAAHLTRSWMRATPYSVGRHFDRGVLDAVKDMCGRMRFDAVYCDHLSMMAYAQHLGLPIVHDAHNVECDLVRRFAGTVGTLRQVPLACEWRLVRAYERRAYRAADLVLAVSESDASRIRQLAGGQCRVRVLPIPVDVPALPFMSELSPDPRLLFVGGLHWPPNADAMEFFVRDVWPLVRREIPTARLTIVGRDDSRAAKRLRAAPGVELTGYVDDVEPLFRQSRAFVVPLRAGGGMRVKIVEALARGLPVVTTPIGVEGIAAVPGTHVLCAETPGDFARAVLQVMTDLPLARALASAGRRLACERYSVSSVEQALLEAVGSVSAERG